MRDELKDIIDQELEEKEQNLEEMYEPMAEELDRLMEEQNNKMRKLQEERKNGFNEDKIVDTLSEEELVDMEDAAMQDAMKYLNRDDN